MINTCDHGHQTTKQTRVIPFCNGNLILCQTHFWQEIAWRQDQNKFAMSEHFKKFGTYQNFDKSILYDIPKWNDLKVYPEK